MPRRSTKEPVIDTDQMDPVVAVEPPIDGTQPTREGLTSEPPVARDDFRRALAHYPTGVAVVTAIGSDIIE